MEKFCIHISELCWLYYQLLVGFIQFCWNFSTLTKNNRLHWVRWRLFRLKGWADGQFWSAEILLAKMKYINLNKNFLCITRSSIWMSTVEAGNKRCILKLVSWTRHTPDKPSTQTGMLMRTFHTAEMLLSHPTRTGEVT
jgi:hypothetical protein